MLSLDDPRSNLARNTLFASLGGEQGPSCKGAEAFAPTEGLSSHSDSWGACSLIIEPLSCLWPYKPRVGPENLHFNQFPAITDVTGHSLRATVVAHSLVCRNSYWVKTVEVWVARIKLYILCNRRKRAWSYLTQSSSLTYSFSSYYERIVLPCTVAVHLLSEGWKRKAFMSNKDKIINWAHSGSFSAMGLPTSVLFTPWDFATTVSVFFQWKTWTKLQFKRQLKRILVWQWYNTLVFDCSHHILLVLYFFPIAAWWNSEFHSIFLGIVYERQAKIFLVLWSTGWL